MIALIIGYTCIFTKQVINIHYHILHDNKEQSTMFYSTSAAMIFVSVFWIYMMKKFKKSIVLVKRVYISIFLIYLTVNFYQWVKMEKEYIDSPEDNEDMVLPTAMVFSILFYGLVQLVSYLETTWYGRGAVLVLQYIIMVIIALIMDIRYAFSLVAFVICFLLSYIYQINEKINKELFYKVYLQNQA